MEFMIDGKEVDEEMFKVSFMDSDKKLTSYVTICGIKFWASAFSLDEKTRIHNAAMKFQELVDASSILRE